MVEIRDSKQIARSTQKSKDIETAALSESSKAIVESASPPADEMYDAQIDTFSPPNSQTLTNVVTRSRTSDSQPSPVTRDAGLSAVTFDSVQRRLGARGQILKPGTTENKTNETTEISACQSRLMETDQVAQVERTHW